MTLSRRIILIATILFATSSCFGYLFWYRIKFNRSAYEKSVTHKKERIAAGRELLTRLKLRAASAMDFIKGRRFNPVYCFLIDMRIPSGRKRFFVYNLKKDTVELAGLVTHGSGSETDTDSLVFSNTPNSYSTSLGRYKIGKSYTGTWGLAYKLYGLDATNDNAFERSVVLHGHSCVPVDEVYPGSICLSLGCPTVSPAFLTRLQEYIDHSKEPLLLWIYY